MGILTLVDYRDELKSGLQRSDLADTQLDRWINMTLQEVAYSFKFREFEGDVTFNTIQADFDYTIGTGLNIDISDFRAIHEEGIWIELPDTERKELLIEVRERWLENVVLEAASEAVPTHYHKYGSQVYLRPVPDVTALTLRFHYWKRAAVLIAGADVSPLLEDWDEALLLGALSKGYRYFSEEQRMINRRNEFLSLVRSRVLETDLEPFPEGGISLPAPTDTEASLGRV